MLIADKIMGALAKSDAPMTVKELAAALCTSEPHIRQGIAVLLAGEDIAPVGFRKGHGRRAVLYGVRK